MIDNAGNINYDNITTFTAADYGFLFSYARKLKVEGLSIGGNFKVIHRKVGDFAKSWGFGLDAGAQYHLKNKWKFGVVARDVTSTFNAWIFTLDDETKEVFAATGNSIPENGLELTLPRLIFAGYRKLEIGKKGIYSSAEIDLDITTDGRRNTLLRTGLVSVDPHMGIEFGFKSYVAIRGGISNLQYVKDLSLWWWSWTCFCSLNSWLMLVSICFCFSSVFWLLSPSVRSLGIILNVRLVGKMPKDRILSRSEDRCRF